MLARSQTHTRTSASPSLILESLQAPNSLQPPGQPDPESMASPALKLLCLQLPGMLSTAIDSQACLCHRTRNTDPDHSEDPTLHSAAGLARLTSCSGAGTPGPPQATTLHPQTRSWQLPPATVGLCRSRAEAAAADFSSSTTLH